MVYDLGFKVTQMTASALFSTVPQGDVLGFGMGAAFNARAVSDWLDLKKSDVSRLADVSVKSVRWDDAMPEAVRDRLLEIAITCNLVAEAFDGDAAKTALWFKAPNPLLGDISPRDMVRLGRFDRLRKFIRSALSERADAPRRHGGTH